MATAGDGRTPYESGGTGGKFRKRPLRRSSPATPYDRPSTAVRNNKPSLLTKLVDPASRLISAGAHRLFSAFRNRLPPLSLQGPPEINEEPHNIHQEAVQNNSTRVLQLNADQSGNSASVSSITGMSDLEQMLKQKTFTRSEIDHLTTLLNSRTTESTQFDAKASSSPSTLVRREKEVASPAELAKSYIGSRPTKVTPPSALRQDPNLHNNATNFPKTPIATKTANGFLTPKSRGRSAMYSMARTPYSRSPLTFSQKGIKSDYSQSTFSHEGKMVNSYGQKRRISVLEDDFGSGGPLRRTRQKANLLSHNDRKELGYTENQKLFLTNESEPKFNKKVEENGGIIMCGAPYANVPTKSTQTATKILQQLERSSPKEKSSQSSLAKMRDRTPTKLTLNMLHGQALKSLEKVDSPKLLSYYRDPLHDISEPISQSKEKEKGKEKVEENGSRKFPVPHNMLSNSVNGDSMVTVKDNAPIVEITDSPLEGSVEPPPKKRAFQMSAPEDLLELDDDDDDEIYVNGHVSFPIIENNKPETSELVINKPIVVEEVETPKLPEASETPVLQEVVKVPEPSVPKESENATSLSKTAAGGSVSEQETGFKFPATTQTEVLPQPTVQMDKAENATSASNAMSSSSAFPLFGTSAEKVSPFSFSANEPAEFKLSTSSDPKPPESTSVINPFTKDEEPKFSVPNKEENGNEQKSTNMFEKSNSLSSAAPDTSASGIFFFGGSAKNSTTPDATPVPNPPLFSSSSPFPAFSANTSSLFGNSSSNITSTDTPSVISFTTAAAATTTSAATTTTAAASSLFSTSVPPPVFSFGSATTTSKAETANTNATNEKEEPKPNMNSSPFATSFATTTTAAATGNSLFGFSSPATASTTNNQSQPSFFNTTTTSQSNTPPSSATITPTVPFQFNSSTSSTSTNSIFGSSTPAFGSSPSFGITPITASSEGKTGNSTNGPTTNVFGSGFNSPSPVFSFGATNTPASTTSTFSFAPAGATNTNSSFATPSVFGNSTPVFGAVTNNNSNDQMSMEDSMAEDSMQTLSPVSPFGQAPSVAPGFMFGSATPTPNLTPTPAAVPFQFGGQPSQPAVQNPFQSSSVEFNGGGGSFSLGSGGDKSGRRIVRVKNKNRRK